MVQNPPREEPKVHAPYAKTGSTWRTVDGETLVEIGGQTMTQEQFDAARAPLLNDSPPASGLYQPGQHLQGRSPTRYVFYAWATDPEIQACEVALDLLRRLDTEVQGRILDWLYDRLLGEH